MQLEGEECVVLIYVKRIKYMYIGGVFGKLNFDR